MGRISVDENRTSRVGAIADGRIYRVLANVGDWVKQGQRLADLQSHVVDVARSNYTKARADLDRRKAELQFARNAHQRAARLYELKAGSLEQLQRAETELKNAELALTAAQADVGLVEENLRHLGLSAEGALEEYGESKSRREGQFEEAELIPVLSPISGTVLKRMISPGAVVTPANDLFVVSDLSSLWVNAEVPERFLPVLKVGRPVQISVQAYPRETFQGRITQIGDILDPDTRTVPVRCQSGNTGQKLKPEMYATVTFNVEEPVETIVVPSSALQEVNGNASVFVEQDPTHFRIRQVQIGRQTATQTEVVSGVKPGENVVADGSFLLKSEMLKKQMSEE
jgi:multidrug efflux pump subunit AcrA (membrane-fusion protein)